MVPPHPPSRSSEILNYTRSYRCCFPVFCFFSYAMANILRAEKYFQNLIESNPNQIAFNMHRLIWNSKRTVSVCCSKSIMVYGKYNLYLQSVNTICICFPAIGLYFESLHSNRANLIKLCDNLLGAKFDMYTCIYLYIV